MTNRADTNRVGARRHRVVAVAGTLLIGLAIVVPTSSFAAGATEQANKALVERWFTEVLNEGNLDLIPELADPGLVMFAPPSAGAVPVGLDGIAGFIANHRSIFPDMAFVEHHVFAQDDLVMSVWTETRTHTGGEYAGYAATGKRIVSDGASLYRIANGKIVEIQIISDWRPFYRSVGVLPSQ